MKKIISVFVLFFVLSSCGNKTEIENAKQELLGNTQKTQEKQQEEDSSLKQEIQNSLVQIIPLDGKSPLNFDSISEASLQTGEVVITGSANSDVEKIEVFFTNPISKYPDDRYELQTYEQGAGVFKYVASSKNQVLDFGQNEYIFRAYSGGKENETKIILNVPSEDINEVKGIETSLIGVEDNTILVNLPTSSKYGEPMKLGEASFTYTQIKGLEIKKQLLDTVSCDALTEYLTERMNSWYYWNTCREIIKDKGVKFNVIRLDGEDYVYERHYIDFVHGFYGIYELEKGKGVTSETIADKNSELKLREFPSLEVMDDLMRDIVNS